MTTEADRFAEVIAGTEVKSYPHPDKPGWWCAEFTHPDGRRFVYSQAGGHDALQAVLLKAKISKAVATGGLVLKDFGDGVKLPVLPETGSS